MKEEFVDYEIASPLRELGFNEPCLGYYTPTKDWMISVNPKYNPKPHFIGPNWCTKNMKMHFMYVPNHGDRDCTFTNVFDKTKRGYDNIAAPLWQQAIDFFRHNYGIYIDLDWGIGWGYRFIPVGTDLTYNWSHFEDNHDWDYPQARKAAILKAIEISKKQ